MGQTQTHPPLGELLREPTSDGGSPRIDDRSKNYAGTSPITRASGTKRVVLARFARNRRMADATYLWAFSALTKSPGARALYDRHRAAGDSHHQALRALANRLVGILHGCLTNQTLYREEIAWGDRDQSRLTA